MDTLFAGSRIAVGAVVMAIAVQSALAAVPDDASGAQTRVQVKAELAEWVAAGYDPLDWLHYPNNAIRAGKIVAARHAAERGGAAE